jgi:hypothetical protein
MGFGLVIAFIKLLQNLTTSNYSALAKSHALQLLQHALNHLSLLIFTGFLLVATFNAVASSAFVFTSLLAGDFHTTNCQAGGYLALTT